MGILGNLRKGFRYFLMSMGVSTYPRKPQPGAVVKAPAVPPAQMPTHPD